jgi:transposase
VRPAFRSPRSIRVRLAASLGRRASLQRPTVWMQRCSLAWARCWSWRRDRPETRPLLELKELYIAREALVKDRTAAKNRRKVLTLSLLKRENSKRLEQIERQIMTIEAAIIQIDEADVGLADRLPS